MDKLTGQPVQHVGFNLVPLYVEEDDRDLTAALERWLHSEDKNGNRYATPAMTASSGPDLNFTAD